MNIYELDYHGIFPERKEDKNTFLKRGNEFYNSALEIKDSLQKDISWIFAQENLFKKRGYSTKIIGREIAGKGDFKLLDVSDDFFENDYKTCPDWISAIGTDSNDRNPNMAYGDIIVDYYFKVKKNKIPMFFSFPEKKDIDQFLENGISPEKVINYLEIINVGEKKQVIIDIIRNPLSMDYKNINFFSWPWTKYESAPELCVLNRLSDNNWNQAYMEIDMKSANLDIIGGAAQIYLSLVLSSATQHAECLIWSLVGLNFFKNAVKHYKSSSNTPSTKIAIENILSGEEDERIDMQYALLRLTPPEIREIGKYQNKSNVSGTEATKHILEKRKTLMSKIILENI